MKSHSKAYKMNLAFKVLKDIISSFLTEKTQKLVEITDLFQKEFMNSPKQIKIVIK
jgi:hypothetical protein